MSFARFFGCWDENTRVRRPYCRGNKLSYTRGIYINNIIISSIITSKPSTNEKTPSGLPGGSANALPPPPPVRFSFVLGLLMMMMLIVIPPKINKRICLSFGYGDEYFLLTLIQNQVPPDHPLPRAPPGLPASSSASPVQMKSAPGAVVAALCAAARQP